MAETLGQAVLEVGLDQTRLEAGLKTIPGTLAATSATLPPLVPRVDGTLAQTQFVTLQQQLARRAATSPLLLPVGLQNARAEALLKGGAGGAESGLGLTFGAVGKSALFAAGALGVFTSAAAAANFALSENLALQNAAAAVETLGVNSDELTAKLRGLSSELNNNVSTVELLKASYDVASSGFANSADAVDVLKASALGALGGFSDVNTVVDATTSVLNAYGLSTTNAEKLVDGFIQTQNDGKIIIGQYAQEIGRVAPVAAAAGVSIEELNAAVSAATAQGVPVGSTFAGLRQAIASILKPTAEATELAATLGLSFNAQALKAQGLGQFLANIAEKTGGAADANVKLFGSVEAVAALQPLLNDGLVKYNKNLDAQTAKSGQAADAADKATNTLSGSIERLKNALSNIATSADKALVPVSKLVQALTFFTENLTKPANFALQFTVLGQIVSGIQKQLDGLGENEGLKKLSETLGREIDTIRKFLAGEKFGTGPEEAEDFERELTALREKRARDEAAKAKEAKFAREAAERDILRPAQEELRIAQRLSGLDGERLRQAKQALEIEKLKREEAKKEAQFKALGGNAAVAEGSGAAITAKAELEAAGTNIKEEIIKGADELRRAGEEISKRYEQASDRAKEAALSFAQTIAGSRFASESAQRQARRDLEARGAEVLNSGLINRQAIEGEFGLALPQIGSLDIQGGGGITQETFTSQVRALDLSRLSLDQLGKLVQETSPLVNGAKTVQESNKELTQVNKELKAVLEQGLLRESNLQITVPVGSQETMFLP